MLGLTSKYLDKINKWPLNNLCEIGFHFKQMHLCLKHIMREEEILVIKTTEYYSTCFMKRKCWTLHQFLGNHYKLMLRTKTRIVRFHFEISTYQTRVWRNTIAKRALFYQSCMTEYRPNRSKRMGS